MQSIASFTLPDVAECTVELPQGLALIDASVWFAPNDDKIKVFYMDSRSSDEMVTLTWYALSPGLEVADNFPGKFFKRVTMSDGHSRFLFFKQDAKKREPIVAQVPAAKDGS